MPRRFSLFPNVLPLCGAAAVCCALAAPLTVWAQASAPDAGALLQQLEHEQKALTLRPVPGAAVQSQPQRPMAGKTVRVQGFRFEGRTLLAPEVLHAALVPFANRVLDFAQLQASAEAVAQAYRDHGWVVKTYLPEQDIADGMVTIGIVEAVFGKVVLSGAPLHRVAQSDVLELFARQQAPGAFLNMDALDRALFLADDLPGVTAAGNLSEGSAPGQTDLVLQLSDEPLLSGGVSTDNTGALSTGAYRLNASLNINSPGGWGDGLNTNTMVSQGSTYVRLAYTVPLGTDGLRLGANGSWMQYRLVNEQYNASGLGGQGTASSAGLDLSYPLLRARSRNLYATLGLDSKRFNNLTGASTTSAYGVTPLTLGLNGNMFDSLAGGGANGASLALTVGELDLSGSPTQAGDATTTQAQGQFAKLRYSLSRQQQIRPDWSVYALFSGQWADKNLDSSEKFYLGGNSGVRAYPSSEGGGAVGQIANLELRWQLPGGFNLLGFYDIGQITVNPRNQFSGAPALNQYSLSGAGFSLGWQALQSAAVKATWARRIGSNPNATSAQTDQDGTLVLDRWWLSVTVPF